MFNPTSTPLPPGVSALLHVFEGPLADVQFPDVDRASLLLLAAQAEAATTALSAARATLSNAQTALGTAETALLSAEAALVVKAQRALGYARVYAQGDAELSCALAAVELSSSRNQGSGVSAREDRPGRELQGHLGTELGAPPKRRGRPRKPPAPPAAVESAAAPAEARAPLFVLPAQPHRRADDGVGNEEQGTASAM